MKRMVPKLQRKNLQRSYGMKGNQRIWQQNYIHNQKERGLCIFCPDKSLKQSFLCEKHYFVSIARGTFGNSDSWEQLRDLFYAQEEKCYLTGRKLYLGLNSSLDHVNPKGNRKEIHNVRWCEKNINRIKRDLNYDEFLKFCKEVIENAKNNSINCDSSDK